MPAWSGEGPLPGQRLLGVSSLDGSEMKFSGVSFIKVLIPFLRISLS